MKLGELGGLAGLEVGSEQADREIYGLAPLPEAGPEELSFFADPRYVKALAKTKAGVILVPLDFQGPHDSLLLRCADPAGVFAGLIPYFCPPPPVWEPGIHRSAVVAETARVEAGATIQAGVVIEPGAQVGAGSVIGANAYIGHGAVIGRDCRISSNCSIGERCVLGDRVILHAGVVIGSDGFGFQFREGRQEKIPQHGMVQIDNDVEIGANSTVDRARFGRTWIGEGTKLDNLVQVGHNVTLGKHCILCAQVAIAGSTRVGDYVTFAGKVGVNGHITIGSRVVITAMAGVVADVPEGAVFGGRPAFDLADYKRNFVQLRRIHKLYDRVAGLEKRLPASGLPPVG